MMKGLDKITERILADAKERARTVLEQAQSDCRAAATDYGKYRELLVALLSCALLEQAKEEKKTLEYGDEIADFDTFEVLLNENDRARFGEGVIEGARRATERRIGAERTAKLRLSDECADIDGGLILRYGEVESNCSITVLLQEMRRELESRISAILFD